MNRCLTLALALFVTEGAALAGDTVTVTSAGSGPQRVLTYAPPASTAQKVRITRTLEVAMETMGQQVTLPAPKVDTDVTAKVTKAAKEGFTIDIAYPRVEIEAMGGAQAQFSASFQGLQDKTGSLTIDPKGTVTGRTGVGEVPTGSTTEPRGFDLSAFYVPLPDQAVGLGATWTITSDTAGPEGLAIHETKKVKVIAIDDRMATLELVFSQHTDPGETNAEGMSIKVQKSDVTGKGVLVMRNDLPLPESATWTMLIDMALDMGGLQTTQKSTVQLTLSSI